MNNPNPELVVLPFHAKFSNTSEYLTFEQLVACLNNGERTSIQIKRSFPGAPHAVGWTIFRRTNSNYLYENKPLFRFERGARRYIRKAYAIHYSLTSEDGMTYSHLHL